MKNTEAWPKENSKGLKPNGNSKVYQYGNIWLKISADAKMPLTKHSFVTNIIK